jgi:hypothetical protein
MAHCLELEASHDRDVRSAITRQRFGSPSQIPSMHFFCPASASLWREGVTPIAKAPEITRKNKWVDSCDGRRVESYTFVRV